MAQIKKGYIKGAVGDGVFREINGRQLLSAQPKTMKQTSATKLHQVNFGKVSVLSSRFRSSISHLLNGFEDGTMANRLTQEFYQCMKTGFDMRTGEHTFEPDTFDGLSNFSFNASSTVRMSVNIKPSITFVDQKLKISIPEFEVLSKISFPKHAELCEIGVVVAIFNLRTGKRVESLQGIKFKIDREQKIFTRQELQYDAPEDCLYIINLFNYFYYYFQTYPTLMNNKNFNPAGIYKALYNPGQFVDTGVYQWEGVSSRKIAFK
jgi:hypothetical protein